MDSDIILVIVVATALAFDFTNGFHDTANAVATSISTRAMPPRFAVALAAILNFVGAFISLEVAATVGQGIVDADAITTDVVFAGLDRRDRLEPRHVVLRPAVELVARADRRASSARPSPPSGAGAVITATGSSRRSSSRRSSRRCSPSSSPASRSSSPTGSSGACARARSTAATGSGSSSSGSMFSLAHGTNDAQKTMGIITLALIAHGNLPADDFDVPDWVVVSSATAIALGTYSGGWRIIRTMGSRIIKMDPAQGFSAQGAGAAVDPRRLAPRLPALDDARDLRRRHGRRRGQAPVGRALGRGRQHRRRLGAHAPGRRAHRRARLRRQRVFGTGALGPVDRRRSAC